MTKPILSFDLTGTLATFEYCDAVWFEGLPSLFARKNVIEISEAREFLRGKYAELGDANALWYDIKYWFQRFDLGDGWRQLLEEFDAHIQFYPETFDVLEELSERYELIMITNACREFAEVETRAIASYFSQIICSVSDFGQVKSTPEFYLEVCRELNQDPAKIIHVGDHWQFDFLAPKECGMTAVFLDRTGEQNNEFTIHNLSQLESKLL